MKALERSVLLGHVAVWLGDDLYEPRFGDQYVAAVQRAVDAAAGGLPQAWPPHERLRHVPTRWDTFTAIADATARRWTAAHRSAAAAGAIPWPRAGRATPLPGLWPAEMRAPLDLNAATIAQLRELPGIGPTTAARIVAHRLVIGRFASVDQLADVPGLTRAAREQAAAFLAVFARGRDDALVDPLLAERDTPVTFPALVRHAHAHGLSIPGVTADPGVTSAAGLARAALAQVAALAQADPAWARDRRADVPWLELAGAARDRMAGLAGAPASVAVVRNSAYLDLVLALLARARSRVRAQVFFLTSSEPGAPGDRLLDALEAAAARGVDVRLIVDTDLDGDYHGAARVNAASIARMRRSALPFRLDELGTTSHGKALTVDDQVVIGSHNWTASAMYVLEETSLYVHDATVAEREVMRFGLLWDRYDPDPATRAIDLSLLAYPVAHEQRILAQARLSTSRALLDALATAAAARARARALGLDPERLVALWRLLGLMHAFALPEATAYALTLTPASTPSAFRRTGVARILAALRALAPLPAPYAGQRLRLDLVEAVHA